MNIPSKRAKGSSAQYQQKYMKPLAGYLPKNKRSTARIFFMMLQIVVFAACVFHLSSNSCLDVMEIVADTDVSVLGDDDATVGLPGAVAANLPKKLASGWDESGLKLYSASALRLSNTDTREVKFRNRPDNNVFVSNDGRIFKNFWSSVVRGGWEPATFNLFDKFVNPGKTTVVDFGTWIGPTLLYHGQFSRRSFGIEADPTAYGVVQYNVELNQKLNPSWGNRVSVDSGCVSTPGDAGKLTMKAAGQAGGSMSGIGQKVAWEKGNNTVSWEVQCYTLDDIFSNYWNIQKPYKDILIKIDVESYECKLIPSFYDWLEEELFLPKMLLSFHPQINQCSDDEFEGVLKLFKLYNHVLIHDGKHELPIQDTDVAGLKNALRRGTVVVYKDAL